MAIKNSRLYTVLVHAVLTSIYFFVPENFLLVTMDLVNLSLQLYSLLSHLLSNIFIDKEWNY